MSRLITYNFKTLLSLQNVSKKYGTEMWALKGISLTIEDSEFCYIVGHSGCGKTTLFRLILREEAPTDGKIFFRDIEVTSLPEDYLSMYRQKLGVVFQDYRLIPTKTVFENVAFAMEVVGKDNKSIAKKVPEILDRVGLISKSQVYPQQLSGGEQQRIAIARAIINDPLLLIADEPTGNLDLETSIEILELLESINHTGTTVVIATHNTELLNRKKRKTIVMDHGTISCISA